MTSFFSLSYILNYAFEYILGALYIFIFGMVANTAADICWNMYEYMFACFYHITY